MAAALTTLSVSYADSSPRGRAKDNPSVTAAEDGKKASPV